MVKKVWQTDRGTDRRTENTICRAAWLQLKTKQNSTQRVGNMPLLPPRHLLPHVLQTMPRNPKYDQLQSKGHHNDENAQSTTKMPRNPKFYPFHQVKTAPQLEQGKSEGFESCDRPSNLTEIGFKSSIHQPVWPWNLMDDPKKQLGTSSSLLKLFASFRSHWWIQTGVTVWKRLIWVKMDDFF